MGRLDTLTGKDVIAALEKAGFRQARQKGSHVFMMHPDGRRTTVPLHGKDTLGPGLISKILRDTNLNRHELTALLDS